jgi:ribonuclease Z
VLGNVSYDIELVELDIGEEVPREGYAVLPLDVAHRTRALGYALVEDERPGTFDVERARELGVPEGPEWGRLQRGQTVSGRAGEVQPGDVLGAVREGRKIVITGDTQPCETVRLAAHQADLLVHDASFLDADAGRARDTGHSTVRECAELAAEAEVRFLAMVHVSTRYPMREALAEARAIYPGAAAPRDFDLVEIPFPERGAPRLVENGARLAPDERAAPEEPA